MRFLQERYPEAAGAPELHAHQEAAHEAAAAGDQKGYLEELREYARTGRAVALAVRRGAA
jgi:hypothetical protein